MQDLFAPSFSFQAATYYSQSDKSITYNKSTLLIEKVDSKKRVYGMKAQASYWLTPKWQVGAYGHYVVSEVQQDGHWRDEIAANASTSKAGSWVGWQESDLALRLQSQTMFSYHDDEDNALNGYTTFDLTGHYELPVGSLGFGIQNLTDRDYTTVWGQRAQLLYAAHYAADAYEYKGRGRTFTLNYQVKY